MSVGNLPLSFVVTLKDFSSAGGVLSMPKKVFIVFNLQAYPLMLLVQKTCLFVLLKEPINHHCKTQKL